MRNQNFPIGSLDDWYEKAVQSLKGKRAESLQTNTYESIILKPLYTKKDEQSVSNYPGGSDFRRGTDLLGYVKNEWKVAQKIQYETFEELKQKLEDALNKGQTANAFEISKTIAASFSELIGDKAGKYPFAINSKQYQAEILNNLSKTGAQLSGYIANDQIALFAEEGVLQEEALQKWANEIKQLNNQYPNLRTILIDTTVYHNGGANAVQELAIAAATGVFYLDKLLEAEVNLEKALSKMIFQFSIGSNFFMELAKIRAARLLWNRITELYGAEEKARGMQISAETSRFTKTIHDPEVNLLRSGNEAFAAVLGGVQYLHVEPFDGITGSSPFSERIARNMQLILKEEAHLQKVADPAGGSWYIETLTDELAEKAWAFFQAIDARGGILEGLKTNWLQKEIAEAFAKKSYDVMTRKQSIVGTNVYAKLDETVTYKKENKVIKNNNIESIPQRRLAESYEQLRRKAQNLADQKGTVPAVGMLCLGELKQYKARLDFMKGFLSAGGINTIESHAIHSIEDAKQFLTSLSAHFICICGTNEQYEALGHEMLNSLKQSFPTREFFLAGLPEKESQNQWAAEGIKQFIHVKSNCYEILSAILNELEVTMDEKQKA
ncbi:methylmalonyl-CoA mutase subunit beta [Neobacillus mesonae]|uniref:methylmalonyl-CoA mutase subunit beta n=1 Tax=Neobacillus mesonae TaxID=1193713 RepID=UPI00203C4B7C|nr:methylmalonyl-CoA mutase subunit beta [Neobacillus mesonae]MCM3566685.1 methylmalonyl-CoA mutase subunit beta [Neobacillus mesonae]